MAMQWNFAEGNPLGNSSGSWAVVIENLYRNLGDVLSTSDQESIGFAKQADATNFSGPPALICTDPPYYNNVDYADLSDFFYVWLRHNLNSVFPKEFSTVLVPKAQELVATPYRFDGDKKRAEEFFEDGLTKAFGNLRENQIRDYPLTIFYAFKQIETDDEDESDNEDLDTTSLASTGWETMLEGLVRAQVVITGTWPMRTEMTAALKAKFNSLASSIVLVCRPRPSDAPVATRREFIAALKRELPPALKQLQQGAIAPVDLAQAAIGPGMAVYSRYSQVLEADGSPMRVRAALALINQSLDEFFAEQEGEFDSDTRWALAWFEQFGHDEGPYGDAETLSKAKNTSTDGLVRAGILQARAGKVRLLRREELQDDWSPETDERRAIWEASQYLIRALDTGGESAAAGLLRRLGGAGETARDLAYRLYAICERKGWAQEALAYNMLAATWLRLVELAGRAESQTELPL